MNLVNRLESQVHLIQHSEYNVNNIEKTNKQKKRNTTNKQSFMISTVKF